MSLTRRELMLAMVTLFAIAFGVLGMQARTRLDLMGEKSEQVAKLRRLRDAERELISMGAAWRARYDAVREQMPVFEQDRRVDIFWLTRMDTLAEKFGVNIIRRQVGSETLVGDVYEFPIECREWDGTLDAITRFLHALQSEGAMLDIRDILIRPHPSVAGRLRGTFSLYCAFMRGVVEEDAAAAPVTAPVSTAVAAPAGTDAAEMDSEEAAAPDNGEPEVSQKLEPAEPVEAADAPASGGRGNSL